MLVSTTRRQSTEGQMGRNWHFKRTSKRRDDVYRKEKNLKTTSLLTQRIKRRRVKEVKL